MTAGSSPANRSGAHALLAALEARGVRHLFGIPGHGAYPIFDALNDVPSIRPIMGRNEQGNTFSALGYAWATGETAVATSVPAAGLLNAATPLLEATMSQDRLLFLLEHDRVHADVARSIALHHRVAERSEDIGPAAVELLDSLAFERPGTAVLEVPNRLLNSPVGPAALPDPPRRAPLDVRGILEAAQVLADAGTVAIVAGASAVAGEAAESVRRLAERLGAPVFSDGLARGILPDTHPLAMGHSWTPGGPGERFLDDCDAVLVIGAPIAAGQNSSEWDTRMVTGLRPPERLARQLVLVDWDDRDQASLPARCRLRGNVGAILGALADGLPGPERPAPSGQQAAALDEARAIAPAYARARIPDGLPFLAALSDALSPDATLLTDSLVAFWLDRLHRVPGPRRLRFPWGTGTLGFGLPAAVGVAIARPGREVVAVMGDGAALYNLQELATLRLYDLRATIVVLNDDSFSAIKHNMQANFGRSNVWRLVNPDFVRLGESFGLRAVRAATPGALAAAIVAARGAAWSTLIEVPLEMLPPSELFDFRFGRAPDAPDA